MIQFKNILKESVSDLKNHLEQNYNANFDERGRVIAYHAAAKSIADQIISSGFFKKGTYFSLDKEYSLSIVRMTKAIYAKGPIKLFEVHLPIDSIDMVFGDIYSERVLTLREVDAKLISTRGILKEDLDISKYDMKEKFDEFNRLYFENKIRQDTTFKWSKATSLGGKAKVRARRLSNNRLELVSPITIYLSNAFIRSDEKELDSLLLHEMIHAYFYSIGVDESHGRLFMAELARVSKLSGIAITKNDSNNNIDETIKPGKEIFAALLSDDDGDLKYFNVYNPTWFRREMMKKTFIELNGKNRLVREMFSSMAHSALKLKLNLEVCHYAKCKFVYQLSLTRSSYLTQRRSEEGFDKGIIENEYLSRYYTANKPSLKEVANYLLTQKDDTLFKCDYKDVKLNEPYPSSK